MARTTVAANKPHNLIYFNRDRGHRFIAKERDPDMEFICNIIHQQEISARSIVEKVLTASNKSVSISATTIENWLKGKTKRPQNFTLKWVAYALGYERSWTKL